MAKARARAAQRRVATMFPKDRLTGLRASKTVLSMTPQDFDDMTKVFSGDKTVRNARVRALKTSDLLTLESLFSEYRMRIIANYSGIGSVSTALKKAKGDSCCCCCTPCCCCCAAADTDPFQE
jgi:hypothetical protein